MPTPAPKATDAQRDTGDPIFLKKNDHNKQFESSIKGKNMQ